MIVGVKELTINGTTLMNGGTPFTPNPYQVHDTLAQSLTQSAALPSVNAWWCGDGLPNVLVRYEWALSYELGDRAPDITVLNFLARLRTKGGTHTFTDWRPERYTYTARTGQQLFYLPCPDAFSANIAGHTTQATYGAKVWRNDVALTVLYKPTVSIGDTVPTGEVWISNTAVKHTDSGTLCAPFKVGTASVIYDDILVEFIPHYRVGVTGAPVVPFEGIARETRSLYLTQVKGT